MTAKDLKALIDRVDIDEIGNQLTFSIGETQFEMEPMAGVPALKLLEELREQLAGSLLTGNIMKLLALPRDFVQNRLIKEMGKKTWFVNPEVKEGRLELGPNMGMALQMKHGVEPSAIYELLGRFMCINFPSTSQAVVKLIGSTVI